MDIKQYIDYFEDIAHLDRSEQFKLLEQASHQVNEQFKFPILTVLPHIVRLLCLLVFCGGTYLLFGYSLWLLIGSLFVSLIAAKVISTESKDKLLLKKIRRLIPPSTEQ